jgi:glyoxylase-like metal-dependent hydrolase (beta-lactamase superfamily II)
MSEQYEVLAIRYGTRESSAAEVFLNYHAYHEPDRPLRMDYFFWVARNAARTVVVDTGFSPAGGAARNRTMLLDTVPALRAGGVPGPDAVSHVILTHAHYDHIGELAQAPGTRVVAGHDPLVAERFGGSDPVIEVSA